MFTVRVQAEDFDVAAEQRALTAGRTDIGALVAFTGLCRAEQGALAALELEHYPGMAEEEMGRVLEEARGRWPLDGATLIHRHGRIAQARTSCSSSRPHATGSPLSRRRSS